MIHNIFKRALLWIVENFLDDYFISKEIYTNTVQDLTEKCAIAEEKVEALTTAHQNRMRDWFFDLQELENLEMHSPVRLQILQYAPSKSVVYALKIFGYECRTAVDIERWLATAVRSMPRSMIRKFIRDSLVQYRFMLRYLNRDPHPISRPIAA